MASNPYRLGRIPSPPDARDWQLRTFISADPVSAAVAELKLTTVGYKNKYWTVPPPNSHWKKGLVLLGQDPVPPSPPPVTKIWENVEPILDQGNFGTCVGNGFAQWGNTLPVDDKYNQVDARKIYYEATVLDGQPDDPDKPGGGQQGATVRSGGKVMQNRKRMLAYAFAATVPEIIAWVSTKGPLVMGTDWYSDMYDVDSGGFVFPTGNIDGGHCYACVGVVPDRKFLVFLNSWGDAWGDGGYFRMYYPDVTKLLQAQGEALAAVELPL